MDSLTSDEAVAELKSETHRWQEKLLERKDAVEAVDEDGKDLLENAFAYIDDAKHFQSEDDWVRAFESVVWAWSWIEIGERLGKIVETDTNRGE